jgi:RNase P subunit RPR2
MNDDEIKRHIAKKWKRKACPKCEVNRWASYGNFEIRLHDRMWQIGPPAPAHHLSPRQPQLVGDTHAGVPAVLLICLNCGHMELLSAVVIEEASREQ